MMQVISNLIVNSIYAMHSGGTLSVSICDASSADEGIVLIVEDDGVGIQPKDLPRVFEAFFTARTTVGTGIGLFVAKQFVEGDGSASRAATNRRSTAPQFGSSCHFILLIYDCFWKSSSCPRCSEHKNPDRHS
jgi:C4-dicarboxylate-specific signal transduction histidine kinase